MKKKWTVQINEDLDNKFREAVFNDKGFHRGNLTQAVEEAMELWVKEKTKEQVKK